MALQKYSLRDIFNRVYDAILKALAIKITGQDITLLTKRSGTDDSRSIIESNGSLAHDAGETAYDWIDMDSYDKALIGVMATIAGGGNCTLQVEMSNDKSNVYNTRFVVNRNGASVASNTYSGGDEVELSVIPKMRYIRPTITPDGTNDISALYIWAVRRP